MKIPQYTSHRSWTKVIQAKIVNQFIEIYEKVSKCSNGNIYYDTSTDEK